MPVYIGFWTGNEREQKQTNKHKAKWICEDQVSDTGPLGLLFVHNVLREMRVIVTYKQKKITINWKSKNYGATKLFYEKFDC